MPQIVGRDDELGVGSAFLSRAASARAAGLSVMLLEGPAGIGKSALWTGLVDQARGLGFTVLTTRPTETDTAMTLAAIADLVACIDEEELESLLEPMSDARRGAIDRVRGVDVTDGSVLEPRLVGVALHELISRAARHRPVLLAIDDVHWVDDSSARVLGFALRRLEEQHVTVLATARTGVNPGLDLQPLATDGDIVRLRLGPLSLGALHHAVADRLGQPLPRAALVRVHSASGGVPLYALEMARQLRDRPTTDVDDTVPLPDDVGALLRRRLDVLPDATRHLLLATALDGTADLDSLAAATGRSVREDLVPASREGVATVERGRIAFAHPLLAAAVVADSSAEERRAAHLLLADASTTPESRARHRALAVAEPSAELAAELESAAAGALGGPTAAAELLELALSATPGDDMADRERRILQLASMLKRVGDVTRASELLDSLASGSEDPLTRARARTLLAVVRYDVDASGSAAVLCEEAIVDAGGDPEVAAHAHAVAALVSWDDFRGRESHVEEAARLLSHVPSPDPVVESLVVFARCETDVAAGRSLDPGAVRRGLELEEVAPNPSVADRFSAALGAWLKYGGDLAEARRWLEHTLRVAYDEGDEGSIAYALSHLPELELLSGHWDDAESYARRHLAASAAYGLEAQRRQAVYNLGLVLAHRGDGDGVAALVGPELAVAAAEGDTWMESCYLIAVGHVRLALQDRAAACEALGRAAQLREEAGHLAPRRFEADLVEALVLQGDVESAARHAERLEQRSRATQSVVAISSSLRAAGLVSAARGDLPGASALLERAVDQALAAGTPFDRARAALALGSVRRRRRERASARDSTSDALAVFSQLGARAWASRAAEELERLGDRRTSTGLTDGERRVAELAARGLTNREAAAELFVSPKTIEATLSRVYTKLGVRSRAQLGAVLAGDAQGGGGTPRP